jgi:hypothetical protein
MQQYRNSVVTLSVGTSCDMCLPLYGHNIFMSVSDCAGACNTLQEGTDAEGVSPSMSMVRT